MQKKKQLFLQKMYGQAKKNPFSSPLLLSFFLFSTLSKEKGGGLRDLFLAIGRRRRRRKREMRSLFHPFLPFPLSRLLQKHPEKEEEMEKREKDQTEEEEEKSLFRA